MYLYLYISGEELLFPKYIEIAIYHFQGSKPKKMNRKVLLLKELRSKLSPLSSRLNYSTYYPESALLIQFIHFKFSILLFWLAFML